MAVPAFVKINCIKSHNTVGGSTYYVQYILMVIPAGTCNELLLSFTEDHKVLHDIVLYWQRALLLFFNANL